MSRRLPSLCVASLAVIALVSPHALASAPVPEGDLSERLLRARHLLHRGAYGDALALAGTVNADAPREARGLQSAALTVRAQVLADLGQPDEAEQAFEAALLTLRGTPNADQLVEILVGIGELRFGLGDTARAERALEEAQTWAATLPRSDQGARIERARGDLARLRGDHRGALARYDAARSQCAVEADASVCVARADIGAGRVALARGDAAAARSGFSAALARLTGEEVARDRAAALVGLATAHRALGERALALTWAEQALTLARAIKHRPLQAQAHQLRGALAFDAGEDDAARAHLEAARGHFRAMRSLRGLAESRAILGALARRRGDAVEATIHLRAAADGFAAVGDRDGLRATHVERAALAQGAGDTAGEVGHLRDALDAGPPPAEQSALLTRLGVLATADGRGDEAARLYRDAVDAAERVQLRRLEARELDRVARARMDTYDRLLDAILPSDTPPSPARVAEALDTSERSVARALVDLLERARLRRRDPRAAELLDALEAVDQEQRAVAAEARAASGAPADATRRLQTLSARQGELERALGAIEPRWLAARGDAARRRVTAAVTRTPARLRDDVAVLKYHLGPERSWLFVIARGEVSVRTLPARSEVAELARAYAATLERPAGTAAQRRTQATLAERLHELLLAPAESLLAANGAQTTRIVVIPHLEVRLVPFDALIVPRRRASPALLAAARRLHTPTYAIYRYTFSYAPSLAALAELGDDAAWRATTDRLPFVAFADPVYTGHATALPRLDRSATEVRAASDHLAPRAGPGTVFLRDQATEDRLKRLALARYRVVHLATHGYAPDDVTAQQQPALFLGAGGDDDGVLRLDEVLDLSLNADLVVLSACESARGALEPGDGLGALTHAFLYAGTSSVMAALWAVEDRHAWQMMDRFYASLATGAPTPTALRDARLALLAGDVAAADPDDAAMRMRGIGGIVDPAAGSPPVPRRRAAARAPRSADPFFWASYVLIGEPGDVF